MSNHRKEHVSISGGVKVFTDACQVFIAWNWRWFIPTGLAVLAICVLCARLYLGSA